MNSAINNPAKKVISIINEHKHPKINAMARRMEQSYPKSESAAVKQTLAIAVTINNHEPLHEDIFDVLSIEGKFGVDLIGGHMLPFIIRVINDEKLKFVSIRMAETHVFKKFLDCLDPDIYTNISISGYNMTDNEVLLLNDINQCHLNFAYGKKKFSKTEDLILRLEDVHQFYTFMEVCYTTFACNIDIGRKQKCGFILINPLCSIPYCIKDNQKYFPLSFFEYEDENKIHPVVKLESWDLAYLKLCFKVQGIKDEFIAIDSCMVISFDVIKNSFSTDLNFEDFWPYNMDNSRFLLVNQKNPSGAWIRTRATVVPAENNISHAVAASAPVTSNGIPAMMNINQNVQLTNKMNSPMSQGSSFGYGAVHVVPQPPLVRAGNGANVIGNTVSYFNVEPPNQCITNMNNQMTISNVISYSTQNSQHATDKSRAEQRLKQQQQQQQRQQQRQQQQQRQRPRQMQQQRQRPRQMQQQRQRQQQRQQIVTTPQIQLSNSSHPVFSSVTNSMMRNARRNVERDLTSMATDIIDLSSPPSSPVPPTVEDTAH